VLVYDLSRVYCTDRPLCSEDLRQRQRSTEYLPRWARKSVHFVFYKDDEDPKENTRSGGKIRNKVIKKVAGWNWWWEVRGEGVCWQAPSLSGAISSPPPLPLPATPHRSHT